MAMRRGNTGWHTWLVLALVAHIIEEGRSYPALSPIRHLLQWQLGPVNGCRLEPYWEPKEDGHDPKGEDGEPAQPYVC
jgi:hypothetical protein